MEKDDKQKSRRSEGKKTKDDRSKDSKDPVNEKTNSKTLEDQQWGNLKLELQQVQRWKKSKVIYAMIALLSISGAWLIVIGLIRFDFRSDPCIGVILCAMTALFLGCILFIYVHSFFECKENMILDQIRDNELNRIQNETKEDIFENSIKMSYKYLDQYYLQTREHAQQGFKVCRDVSVCGFALICIGIVFMFLDHTSPAYITCGAGTITEFIAAVFFYLYNKTVISMSNYHNKLVLSHNVSIALKIAESLPQDEKVNVKKEIINELLKDFNVHLGKEDGKSEADP